MAKLLPQSKMRAWQYSSTKGGIENNLKINPSTPLPKAKPNQHLVQVIAAALNPIDYKPAELPLFGGFMIPKPATPGIDFAGCIVSPAAGSSFKPGQLIFGVAGTSPLAGGALAEFAIVDAQSASALPDDVDPVDAATIGVAGLTAYQSIVSRVKKGDKVFINGGSGGTGAFGIQMAKAVGCHVTTTCSTVNVELCKSLGADVVVDYKQGSVLEALKARGCRFDHAVDNVGMDKELYWRSSEYLRPGAAYVMVGFVPSLANTVDSVKRKLWPSFLGGIKGKIESFWPQPSSKDLTQIVEWMKEGKVRSVVDQKYSFEQVPSAFEKLKTGRAKGKIVVDIALETYRKAWEE